MRNGDVRLQLRQAERIGVRVGGAQLRRPIKTPAKPSRPAFARARIAALFDLPRSAEAGGQVSLPGFVSANELGRLYASVDFVALPSEVEIGGMAVAEAIAVGAPMLLAAKASSAGVFDHAEAIRLVAGGAEAWTTALAEMAHDRGLRRNLRQAALDYAAQRLASWSDMLRDDLTPGWRAALARAPA